MCVLFLYNANITEKVEAVGDLELMSAEVPACRRAASAPAGCQSRRASEHNLVPLPGSYLADKCQDLTDQTDETEQKKERLLSTH